MDYLLRQLLPHTSALVFLAIGIGVGTLLAGWIEYLTTEPPGSARTRWTRYNPLAGLTSPNRRWWLLVQLGTGLLFAAFVFCMLQWQCQKTPSVVPSEYWRQGRIVYQLILLSLLVAATGTDFRDYVIPDAITVTGIVIAIAGATYSGEVQIVHIWVDWNNEEPLKGPYLPAWMDQHRHLHGLAWSAAGLIAGAGITWLVRVVSATMLGQESLGFGDVTLMAMIGSFVGWQPVILIFLLAPFCGLLVVMTARLLTGRTFIPYGPFLSAATVVVLFGWRWLWTPMRYIFGHAPSLLLLGGSAFTALLVLLGLLRLYRAIPVTGRTQTETGEQAPEQSETDAPTAETDPHA